MSIKVEDLTLEVEKLLKNYNNVIIFKIKTNTSESMKDLVKMTKDTAPVDKRNVKRAGKYKKSITSKVTQDTALAHEEMWYVKGKEYRLSHLLEFGHATRNGKKTKAFGFINKSLQSVAEDYLKKIEEAIKDD